jgi:sarcosine oxidase subunit alpha
MPRAPLCGMGVCFECRVQVDGVAHVRACMTPVSDGMQVVTDD